LGGQGRLEFFEQQPQFWFGLCVAREAVPEVMAALVDGDANALASAMEKIIAHPNFAAEFRRRGLARARTWPDVVAAARKHQWIYATAASS
jgi:hypothetical protein